MRLLIDTHVLLWWDMQHPSLNATVRDLLADPENAIYVSAASVWEIATKARSGKLAFEGSVLKTLSQNGFEPLAISVADAELAGSLDWSHRDPFDRMLVAQSRNHKLTLVSADAALRSRTDIAQIWAR